MGDGRNRRPPGGAARRRRAGGASAWTSALRRQLVPLIAVFAAVLLTGLALTLLQPRRYTATAEVLLDDGDGDAAVAAVRSRTMAAKVAAGLRDGRSIDALIEGVSARRFDETLSMAIGFTGPRADLAARTANAYARLYAAGPSAPAAAAARPNPRVLSEADPPAGPSAPRPIVNALVTLAAAVLAAVAAALLAERLFGGLTSGNEVEDRLGLHHLGIVPAVGSVVPGATSPLAAIVDAPMSGYAEAFRSLVPAIRYAGGGRAQVVAFAAATAGEGASTLAAGLARTLAIGGETVVLVDCGGGGTETGATEASGVSLVAADAGALAAMLDDLRARFAHVLLDLPPILSSPQAREAAAMADLLVVAVRWRSTAPRAVTKALSLLPRDVRTGGVVLTRVDMHKQVKYARGDASYYYTRLSKYYS